MKYILILLATTLSLTLFAGEKLCHNDKNEYSSVVKFCNDTDKKCATGFQCKEMSDSSKPIGAVAGVGQKADSDCKDIVQTQAELDFQNALKAKANGAGQR